MIKQPQQASTRVIFNTGILYAKMLIIMGISLYSTRLILNYLGESDFGIFSLIAGIIAMLLFINAAMTTSTQRYLSYYQGTGDFHMQKKIFVNSWILHIFIGTVVLIVLEIIAPFLFNGFLNIPPDRMQTAKIVYHFMTASVFFTIIAVPFTATLNAHENMFWVAIVSLIEYTLKLLIAISLTFFIQSERLILYGLLTAVTTLISFLIYGIYCIKKYKECSVTSYKMDKPLLRELGAFAGWNFVGNFAVVGRNQGVAIVLNLFFGSVVNAAYGVANQVAGQMTSLSSTLLRALNPQIMKSEGMNDRTRTLRLAMIASKFGFFLVLLVAIPCIFEMPAILKFWLKNVPENTVVFCSLILVSLLINQLTIGLQSAAQSVGRIKWYQIIVGGILLLNLPLSYILLKLDFSAYSVMICFIVTEIFACTFRILFLRKLAGLSVWEYFQRVILKTLLPTLLSTSVCWLIIIFFVGSYRFLLTVAISAIVLIISAYFAGLCKDERLLIDRMIVKIFKKITKREYIG